MQTETNANAIVSTSPVTSPASAVIPAATAATLPVVKPSSKPRTAKAKAKPAKPAKAASKPAKPAQPAKPDRNPVITANRATVAAICETPSLSVRRSLRVVSGSVYADRFREPIQRTTLAKLTLRDESLLGLFHKRGSIVPADHNVDAGAFSRICSVGFIKLGDKAGTFTLSAAGASHARLLVKRLAS